MVFFHHLTPRHFNPLVTNFIIELQAGVPVFFVLSGFLIAYRYSDVATSTKPWIKQYLVNRFARIYPLYFIITVANGLYFKLSALPFALNITLLLGYFTNYVFNPAPQNWSLTVECTFYLALPLILFLTRKKWPLLSQLALFLSIGFLLTFIFKNIHFAWLFTDYSFTFILTFFGRCFEFLTGVYLALNLKRCPVSKSKYLFTFLGAVGLPVCVFLISISGGLNSVKGMLMHNFLLPLPIASLIYGLVNEKTKLAAVLETSLFELLGKSSYAFFLIHVGFLHSLFNRYVVSNLFIELLFTTAASVLLFKFIESPLYNFTRKKLKKAG